MEINNIQDVIAMIKSKGSLGAGGIYTYSTWLTPNISRILLEHNPHNRDLKEQHAYDIAELLTEGRWEANGTSIVITDEDTLGDGQHRCTGVVISGVSMIVTMTYGVANKVKTLATIDQPQIRTVRDICKLSRWENAPGNDVISASNLIINVTDGVDIRASDRQAKSEFLLSHADEISPWVAWAKGLAKESTTALPGRTRGTGTRAVGATALSVLAWHLTNEGADADTVVEFYEAVVNPWSASTALSENRRGLLEALHRHTRMFPLNRIGGGNAPKVLLTQYAAHIVAYNRYVLDEKVQMIRAPKVEYKSLTDLPGVVTGPKREYITAGQGR